MPRRKWIPTACATFYCLSLPMGSPSWISHACRMWLNADASLVDTFNFEASDNSKLFCPYCTIMSVWRLPTLLPLSSLLTTLLCDWILMIRPTWRRLKSSGVPGEQPPPNVQQELTVSGILVQELLSQFYYLGQEASQIGLRPAPSRISVCFRGWWDQLNALSFLNYKRWWTKTR